MDDLKSVDTTILAREISSALTLGKAHIFAIDYTNDLNYRTVSLENEGYIIRSRLKKSTMEFYSYVTAQTITRDHLVILAFSPVIHYHFAIISFHLKNLRMQFSPIKPGPHAIGCVQICPVLAVHWGDGSNNPDEDTKKN